MRDRIGFGTGQGVLRHAQRTFGVHQDRAHLGCEGRGVKRLFRDQDRGPGIAATRADHLFTPFFTTREDGLGLGLNIPLGPLMATVGGKALYTDPNDSDSGYAAAVGGGLQWKIGDSLRLFGEYYYSPDSLSSGIESYTEANAGARYTIMRPISIEAGYRYLNLAGKDGNRDNAVADGPYVGVSASF